MTPKIRCLILFPRLGLCTPPKHKPLNCGFFVPQINSMNRPSAGFFVPGDQFMGDISHFFDSSEFTCQCGCNTNNINKSFVSRLSSARKYAGVSFVITSGCRCPAHNKNVGGLANSSHLVGVAADIKINGSESRYKVLSGLVRAGFTRIGIAKNFIHVDCDNTKPKNVIWMY